MTPDNLFGNGVGNLSPEPSIAAAVAQDFLNSKIQARHIINWNAANSLFLAMQQQAKQYGMEPEVRSKIIPFPSPNNSTVNVLSMDPSLMMKMLEMLASGSGEGKPDTGSGSFTPTPAAPASPILTPTAPAAPAPVAPVTPIAPARPVAPKTTPRPAAPVVSKPTSPPPKKEWPWWVPAAWSAAGTLLVASPVLYGIFQWLQSDPVPVQQPPAVSQPVQPEPAKSDVGFDGGVQVR